MGSVLHPAAPDTFLVGNLPGSNMRRKEEALYEVAMDFREAGWPSEFDYEEGHDLFRFADGKFAFLNEYGNGRRPRELRVMG